MNNPFRMASCLLVMLSAATSVCAQTPSFQPDLTFSGSSLSGLTQIGDAKWTASNGEITGKGSGWLVFDKPMQDTGLYLQFRCEAECNAGVLLRAEKKNGVTNGLLLSIQGQELAAYRVTLNPDGKETGRTKLRNAGGQIRFAP